MRWMAGLLLLIVLVLHLPGLANRVFNNDEAYVATVADVLANGGRLYVDAVDRKPPGVFYIYHWLFELTGSRALWIPRLAAVVAHTATAFLVWLMARRRFDARTAVLVGVLAALASATVTPGDAQTAEFEVFMMPFIAGAMLLADQRRAFGSGLALGAATMMKQTAAVTLLPLVFVFLRLRAGRWTGLVKLAVGAAIPLAVCAVLFDVDRFWFWVFGGANSSYLDVGSGGAGLVFNRFLSMTAAVLALNLAALGLAAVALRVWRTDLDLWLWLLSAAIGVVSGTRFFGHYYWQIMPPLCLLAGRGITLLPRRIGALGVGLAAFTAAGAAIVVVAFRIGGPSNDYQTLADYARANTAPTDRIFVWGHEPSVYWAADRLPASRVITTGFLTGHTAVRPKGFAGIERAVPGIWEDVMSDLAAHPPILFFNTEPTDPSRSADYPITDYPAMEAFLTENYLQVAVIDGTTVYKLIEP